MFNQIMRRPSLEDAPSSGSARALIIVSTLLVVVYIAVLVKLV